MTARIFKIMMPNSCARSELEGGTQIQRVGRRGDSLTAHIYGTMMQMGSCVESEFHGEAQIRYSGPGGFHGGFMPAWHHFV